MLLFRGVLLGRGCGNLRGGDECDDDDEGVLCSHRGRRMRGRLALMVPFRLIGSWSRLIVEYKGIYVLTYLHVTAS